MRLMGRLKTRLYNIDVAKDTVCHGFQVALGIDGITKKSIESELEEEESMLEEKDIFFSLSHMCRRFQIFA